MRSDLVSLIRRLSGSLGRILFEEGGGCTSISGGAVCGIGVRVRWSKCGGRGGSVELWNSYLSPRSSRSSAV